MNPLASTSMTSDLRVTNDGDPSATGDALAVSWCQDAEAQSAQVAVLCRLALDLEALGAPPGLVESTHDAAAYVRELSRRELRRAHSERPLPIPALASAPPCTHATIASRAMLELYLPSATVEHLAAAGADRATENDVRAAHAKSAMEAEARVAVALAVVRWAVEAGGERARAAVEASLDDVDALAAAQVIRLGAFAVDAHLGPFAIEAIARAVAGNARQSARALLRDWTETHASVAPESDRWLAAKATSEPASGKLPPIECRTQRI
jgi:hypothetical protein